MYVVATVHRGEHTHTHAHTQHEWLSEGNATSTQLCSAFRVLLVAASAVGLGRVQLPRQSSDEEKRREEEDDREERSERVSRETEERERERERSSTRRVHGSGLRTQDMDLTARLVYPSRSLSLSLSPPHTSPYLSRTLCERIFVLRCTPSLSPLFTTQIESNRIDLSVAEWIQRSRSIFPLPTRERYRFSRGAFSSSFQFPVSSFKEDGHARVGCSRKKLFAAPRERGS